MAISPDWQKRPSPTGGGRFAIRTNPRADLGGPDRRFDTLNRSQGNPLQPTPASDMSKTTKSDRYLYPPCSSRHHDLAAKRASERAGYARWLGTKDCTECWRESRDGEGGGEPGGALAERRAHELAETKAWEARCDMPVLSGSDKAVEWARRVRYQLLADAYEVLGLSDEQFASRIETPARRVTSASWWIDQRDAEVGDIEELVVDAASSDVARVSENPY